VVLLRVGCIRASDIRLVIAGLASSTMTSASAATVSALDSSQVKNLGLAAIVAVLVIGVLISWLVTKIVTRLIVVVVAVVLAFALYNQRSRVITAIDQTAKKCDVTFFGIHVTPSDENIKRACAAVASRPGK
jgi:hypothetical protein